MTIGLHVEGIFRLSGAASEVEQLCQAFEKKIMIHQINNHDDINTPSNLIDLSRYDIHAVAGVMKKYLRCLPEPAIPATHHHQFLQHISSTTNDDENDHMGILADLVTSLPRAHFHLILFIIELASHIHQYQHINMMNPEALAVVLAPVCTGLDHRLKDIPAFAAINNKKKCSPAAAETLDRLVQANAKWTQIWTLMIENHKFLLNKWYPSVDIAAMTTTTRHSFKNYMNMPTTLTLAEPEAAAGQHSIMIAAPHQQQYYYQNFVSSPPPSVTPPPMVASKSTITTTAPWSPSIQKHQTSTNQKQRKKQKNYGVVVMRPGAKCHSLLSKPTSSIEDLNHDLLNSPPNFSMLPMSNNKENSYDRRRRTRSMFTPNIPPLV
ncbi:hypothetical protein INT45_002519 [Circinella minor]|uniref:Rho-GAP domain-containing protein n=1 Tax=Circinella minor TaxID=1195481 RepID=A0A8H7SCN2_9FUNG|nr:hypothetical protein INT45_002519 [Circinella minor]